MSGDGEGLGALGDDDVRRLVEVIESLEHSPFDYLELEIGDLRVVLGKGTPPEAPAAPAGRSVVADPPRAAEQPRATEQPGSTAIAAQVAPEGAVPAEPAPHRPAEAGGLVAITAPMMGVFYAQPEPGAPPFVTVGSHVDPDTTVAVVEVMKLFNAVPAGVAGTVVEVLALNAALVEYGEPLFRVRPDEAPGA